MVSWIENQRETDTEIFQERRESEAVHYREELFRQANEVRKQDRQLIAGNLLHEAVTAHRALSPIGKTITDAVTFYSEHLKASTKQSKAPLTDAIGNFFTPKKKRALKETPSNAIGKLLTIFKKHSKVAH